LACHRVKAPHHWRGGEQLADARLTNEWSRRAPDRESARLIRNVRRLNILIAENSILENTFTKLQGQYLAFIVAYTKLNRRAPAEADFRRYFDVTPPSVHNMILTLERRGFITRTPGRARSIEIVMPVHEVPPLD
jgi:LexA DNA binding domain-containing protein